MDIKEILRGLPSSGSGQNPVIGSCEYDNVSSNSIKGVEILDQLSNYQLLKDCPWNLFPYYIEGKVIYILDIRSFRTVKLLW
jgi:hypothetical protein